ncbi:IS110 family transposase [Salinisphaera sp.]|uniref:IS110 family transposase n=1 Tax=Salinisphaera sp. TaxID=1914330 RepID=UPI002D788025|nr:IS110 family transposase [Salinisphaera sp.]HET7313354.1 IS110 family transposase [Salinisphaera sp.]
MAAELRVAVDVGSRFHQVAIGNAAGELVDEFRIDHQDAGFRQFFTRIERQGLRDIRVAMEGYNGWARPLDQQVLARGWRLYNVNNLKLARYKEIFPAPAKTDAIDARRMLELFAFDGQRAFGRDVLQEVTAASEAQRQLKYLTRRRRQQVADRARRLTRLRCDLQAVCPDLLALTGAADNRWFLRFVTCRDRLTALPRLQEKSIAGIRGVGAKTLPRIRAWQRQAMFGANIDLADADIVADARAICDLDDRIQRLNRRIDAVAAECPMAQHLRSIPGFGPIGTAELSGEIGALPQFDSEASLALYLGMAPLDHSSGVQQRGKRPKCVNTRCQTALMTCIVRHMAQVPESRAYYDRKRAQGKRHNQAVRSLGRHLVRVIWRMLKNKRDYEVKFKMP